MDELPCSTQYFEANKYHAVPPPYTGNFMPPKPDLVFSNEHVVSESVTSLPDIAKSKVKTSETKLKNVSAPIIEDWVSDSKDEDEIETKTKQIKPSFAKVQFVKPTKHVKSPRKSIKQTSSRAAVLVITARLINTTYPRSTVNGAKPSSNVLHKSHSPVKRTFNQRTASKNNDLKEKVNIAKRLMVDLLHLEEVLKEVKLLEKVKLDFEDVYFVKELKFNLFSVSQMCDKKNSVLFTKTKYLVLSLDFKLLDENQVLLKVPRQNNMYSFELKNVVPLGGLTCLSAKATIDESNLWHKRLGHKNFKTMNKLVRGNLVRGIENQLNHRVKIIRCDNGTEFKSSEMNQFYQMKGIKREFSVARTPQQDRVAERKNRTLTEAARTMLANSLLPTTFWAEAVNTACYIQNRVLACEGFLVRYSINSKAFMVFNSRTKKVEENLHIKFLENKSNVVGKGPEWLFVIDLLTKSINYELVTAKNLTNDNAGTEINANVGQARQEKASDHEYILLPFMPSNSPLSSSTQSSDDKDADEVPGKGDEDVSKGSGIETGIFDDVYDDREVGAEANINNLELLTVFSLIPITRVHKDHPKEQIIKDLNLATQTRRIINFSKENAMIENLVDLLNGKRAIGTKWVFRNKKDERGIVVRNKARLVAQVYTQKEGIDYDKVFAPVARIEAIRLFFAYALFMGFIMYQMDVKSAFLYDTIEKEVYVCQPPGFEDSHFPNKVYKVEKALHGLYQAPRAWYETLSTYLLVNGFRRGIIDKTLFIKKDRGDIILVQVYVDDIIFRSTKKSLCDEFKQTVHKRFQISSMRELTFFLGLQVKQKDDGIFISQDKYVADILKKFDFTTVKTASTPIEPNKALIKDAEAEDVDVRLYRLMIGSLMYLIDSRLDIMFVVCACARF
nr:hypothetical protein [Tanacetum cinerariifolium]